MLKKFHLLFLFAVILLCVFYTKLIYNTFRPKIPSSGSPIILYSNQCRQDLRSTIIQAIKSAKKSIHLVMFGLSDENVIQELRNQANKNLKMNVYYDKRSSPNIILPNNSATGVKKNGLMHQKILVTDNNTAFIGSTNLTRASLSMHNNLIVGIYSPEIAKFLTEKTPFNVGRITKNIRGQDIEIWLLPDTKNIALYRLITLIRSAKKSMKIAMFTLTHPHLIDEVIKAKKKGVLVTVVVDYHSSIGASALAIKNLKKNNVTVLLSRGPELLHHKYLYIDEKTLVCGSANWTKAAFNKNRDLLLILHNLRAGQKSFMNKLQKTIEIQAN